MYNVKIDKYIIHFKFYLLEIVIMVEAIVHNCLNIRIYGFLLDLCIFS